MHKNKGIKDDCIDKEGEGIEIQAKTMSETMANSSGPEACLYAAGGMTRGSTFGGAGHVSQTRASYLSGPRRGEP